jgi:hypothetical protein
MTFRVIPSRCVTGRGITLSGKDDIKANDLSRAACGGRGAPGLRFFTRKECIAMASGNDMKAANETYAGFITLFKWGTALAVLSAVFVVGLIAS